MYVRCRGEAEAREGAPSGTRDKAGGQATQAAEPGYWVEEGPTQSSRGARAGVGPSDSGARLPASLRSRARGPEDRLGAGGRRRRADSSCCGCLVPSTAEELSFLPSLLPSPPHLM